MREVPARLVQAIERDLPATASGDVLVALSGGLDSTCLLHALAAQRPHPRVRRVRAVHIDHGLHPDSQEWADRCAELAHLLGVDYEARRVLVALDDKEGTESAARRVRYEALRELMEPGETLLTAHHADDQLETVLLALARGSGVDGLAAMPRCRRFGLGWHLRPLLDLTRAELLAWGSSQSLKWLQDPSNLDVRFDRNYLRSEVLPVLRRRWPSVAHSASRSAAHLAEAATLLDDLAARDFAAASIERCLKVSALEVLEPARRRNLLRYWIHACGARPPSTRKLAALEHDMLVARFDRIPRTAWDGFEVHRHRGLLYCSPELPALQPLPADWDWRVPLSMPGASGQIRAEIAHGRGASRARLPSRLRMAHRRGGEVLRLAAHRHRRPLKKLLQEANVLPWWRDRLPLFYDGDALLAVADLWVAAEYAASPDEEGVRFVWEGRPQIQTCG